MKSFKKSKNLKHQNNEKNNKKTIMQHTNKNNSDSNFHDCSESTLKENVLNKTIDNKFYLKKVDRHIKINKKLKMSHSKFDNSNIISAPNHYKHETILNNTNYPNHYKHETILNNTNYPNKVSHGDLRAKTFLNKFKTLNKINNHTYTHNSLDPTITHSKSDDLDEEDYDYTVGMREAMLTTSDNPFDPFTQFDSWFAFDSDMNYHTCSYLSRIAKTSDELSEIDNIIATNLAIDEIVMLNILGIYKKVYRKE